MISEVVGAPKNYEVARFAHNSSQDTNSINYNFYFYNGGYTPNYTTFTSATETSWTSSYLSAGFTVSDLYYKRRSFSNSFFKLDFYDSPNDSNQRIYFTIILPTSQGKEIFATLSEILPDVKIKTPQFSLDYVGDKEGFYIFFLKRLNLA